MFCWTKFGKYWNNSPTLKWTEDDEERWTRGHLICPNNLTTFSDIFSDTPPVKCPYYLEQVVSQQGVIKNA